LALPHPIGLPGEPGGYSLDWSELTEGCASPFTHVWEKAEHLFRAADKSSLPQNRVTTGTALRTAAKLSRQAALPRR